MRVLNAEDTLAVMVAQAKLPQPEREYRFHDLRLWRFDFAWPDLKIAVEVEGGVFAKGRHTRGKGFSDDCVKYNAATLDGWRLLRFTTAQVDNGDAITSISFLIAKDVTDEKETETANSV